MAASGQYPAYQDGDPVTLGAYVPLSRGSTPSDTARHALELLVSQALNDAEHAAADVVRSPLFDGIVAVGADGLPRIHSATLDMHDH